jgi:hypothetical protein
MGAVRGVRLRPDFTDSASAGNLLYDLVAAGLIVAALVVALRTSRDLPGAFDPDHFRDIAQAQTARDGHPLTDPYYKGEWIWYNPFLAWTLAAGSAVTKTTVEAFHIHKGPWLNLLGPIMFYLLSVRLVGRRAALGALALYLFFLVGSEHSWATATYSPWLFAATFSEGLFFGTALVELWAARKPTVVRASLAGACIGLTFLGHTAPALILIVMAGALLWRQWRALAAASVAALLVASPFLVAILWHYHLRVLNPEPITYVYDPISRSRIVHTVASHAFVVALAVLGLWRIRSRLVWAWLIAAAGLTVSTIFGLTPLVPAFHFWLYFTALLAILAGRTLAFACRPAPIFIALTLALVVWNWKPYTERADLQGGRFLAARRFSEHIEASVLLRMVTSPDEVVLGTPAGVRLIIGPAGRKTVAPDPLFSNPYVDYQSRRTDRDRMLMAFQSQDLATFMNLARARDVGATVMTGSHDCGVAAQMFPLTYRTQDVCISLVR